MPSLAPRRDAAKPMEGANAVELTRALTARDGFMIVAGSVIGSGIFLVPGPIATQLGSLRAVLCIWFFGGVLSIFGALSLAELGAMFPGAGGLYLYLRRAYGRSMAFLYGWGLLSMIHSGSIATLGAGFGLYLAQVFSLSPMQQRVAAVLSVMALTAVNLFGLSTAKHMQNISTTVKIGGLLLFAGMLFSRGHGAALASSWQADAHAANPLPYGVALIAVLWAFEGWHVVSFTAGEFKNPERDLPRSLISGTLAIGALYLLLNVAYYSVLSPHAIRGVDSAAGAAMQAAYGENATRFVSILILLSMAGAMNGMILTGPRVYFAMARDGDFLAVMGRLDSRFHAPAIALAVQGIWASALILMGSFQQLFTDVIFTAWIFYGLAVAAVIVLRRRQPERARPFRTPGYPLVPLLFVLAAGTVVTSSLLQQPRNSLAGIGLILLGLPVYAWFAYRQRRVGG